MLILNANIGSSMNSAFKTSDAFWLVTYKEKVLIDKEQGKLISGYWSDLASFHAFEEDVLHIGEVADKGFYLIDIGAQSFDEESFTALSLRALVMQLPQKFFPMVSRAWQLSLFLRTHRYCGQCGSKMTRVDWELATHCHNCQHRCYPRISPCIIVAIKHQDKILLARGRHHINNMYSTLAGFVESGETLEQAVHREVMEEVNVKVKNLRYFGSQPWPFPHSLMCGFIADYDEGDIKVDGDEILEAHWYQIDNLPNVPPVFSIAGQLIVEAKKLIADSEKESERSSD